MRTIKPLEMMSICCICSSFAFLAGVTFCSYWQEANQKGSQSMLASCINLLYSQYESSGSFPRSEKQLEELAQGWLRQSIRNHRITYTCKEDADGNQLCIVGAECASWPVRTAVIGIIRKSPNGTSEMYRFKGLDAY